MGVDGSSGPAEEPDSREDPGSSRFLTLAKRLGRQSEPRQDRAEARLITRAKRGDKVAIAELYSRHVDMIYRYTYARVRDVNTAEDLTAQVFLRALEGLDSYEPVGVPFRAWLYRIAHARTVDHWRQQQRRQEVMLVDTIPAREPLPEDAAIASSQWETALDLIAQLTDEQRDVILMRFIEEMSLAEVALALGKTVGSVKALQHRALASLARLLRERTGSTMDQDD